MSERMVLSCEISRANASVRWYRNGLEVEENSNLILEVDGVYRRLIIPETTVSDSAEYVCDTNDDSVTFFVNIAGDVICPKKTPKEIKHCMCRTFLHAVALQFPSQFNQVSLPHLTSVPDLSKALVVELEMQPSSKI